MIHHDRQDAGKQLAATLRRFKGKNTVVLALPRGGVVLGAEVACELEAPLGLVLVRKIGHPSYSEYAIGAVAEDNPALYNEGDITPLNKEWLRQAEASARAINDHRREYYFGKDFTPPEVSRKTVLLVDDGIATGLTMQAAIQAVKRERPKQIVVAAPVASVESVEELRGTVDEIIILDDPSAFLGTIGAHYQLFEQVKDEKVRNLIQQIQDELYQTTKKQPGSNT